MGIRLIGQQHPYTKCLAIDVDETLIVNGKPNGDVVAYARDRKALGYEIILWSARGKSHAARIAESHNLIDLFDSIVSKPGYVIDDLGWSWTKYTRVVRLSSLRERAAQ